MSPRFLYHKIVSASTAVLTLLCISVAVGHAEKQKVFAEYPELTPDRCADLPPEQLYEELHLLGTGSEGGHDYFCKVYQRRLKAFTDEHYPNAKRYRSDIIASFQSMMLYIAEVWRPEGNLGHRYERIGASAEWVIYQAEKSKYRLTEDAGYSAADVEEYALAISRRFGRSYRFDDLSLEFLHKAIKHLVNATQEDKYEPDIHRRRYFSDALYRLLSQYDKRP